MTFTHLEVHSHFTLLGAIPSVTELAARAAADGLTHLALTDTNALYGAVAFARACREAGIQPIIGMTVTMAEPSPPAPLPAREGGGSLPSPGRGGAGGEVKLARRVALVDAWLAGADPVLQLRGYKALTEATGDATWEDRAFATLAAIIEGSTLKVQGSSVHPSSFILHPSALKHSCRVEAAARIDFGGGWTDTPPYSIERGGTVLNAALTLHGRYPIIAEAKWLPQPRLILESRDIDAAVEPACAGELLAYANPADPFALPKAALVLRGFVPEGIPPETPVSELARRWGGGLWLSTATHIPRGSGLGTSSIMAGAVLACLSSLLGGSFDFTPHPSTTATNGVASAQETLRSAQDASSANTDDFTPHPSTTATNDVASAQETLRSAQDASSANTDRTTFALHPSSFILHPSSLILHPSSLFAEVLCLEQMLTTGGGWQDQVGGLTGGIKLVTTQPGLPQRIQVDPVVLAPETVAALTERLVMVYTGQQRLARNLLRAVMGRWMARDPEMVWLQAEIARLALAMRAALLAGDLDGFGALLSEHWALNKRMDPGCTNPFIDGLFATLAPYLAGGKLAGAGGGGFVMAIARDGQAARDLSAALAAQYPGTPVAVWPCAVPGEGLRVEG